MIGMINIPNDSPAEFYAAPSRFFTDIGPSPSKSGDHEPDVIYKPPTSLFARRKNTDQVNYLSDGRKVQNGQVSNPASAPKMWKELIIRTFVHKIEDEIQSPVEQFQTIQQAFPKLNQNKKALSSSTYSLVSHDRIKSQCAKCSPKKKSGGSASDARPCHLMSKSSSKLHEHEHPVQSKSAPASTRSTLSPDAAFYITAVPHHNMLASLGKVMRRRSDRSLNRD